MKKYRIYLADGSYFGSFYFSAAALRQYGATIKGNTARFH